MRKIYCLVLFLCLLIFLNSIETFADIGAYFPVMKDGDKCSTEIYSVYQNGNSTPVESSYYSYSWSDGYKYIEGIKCLIFYGSNTGYSKAMNYWDYCVAGNEQRMYSVISLEDDGGINDITEYIPYYLIVNTGWDVGNTYDNQYEYSVTGVYTTNVSVSRTIWITGYENVSTKFGYYPNSLKYIVEYETTITSNGYTNTSSSTQTWWAAKDIGAIKYESSGDNWRSTAEYKMKCDENPDPPVTVKYYCDNDGDGYTDAKSDGTCQGAGCQPSGCKTVPGNDCNDNNMSVYPGAIEGPIGSPTCSDGKDNDCDASTDSIDPECSLPPQSPSDLIITSVADIPSSLKAGTKLTVRYTTLNQGEKRSGNSVTRYYFSQDTVKDDNDILLKGKKTKPLKAGKSSDGKTKLTVSETTPPGNYYLIVCADDIDEVTESNEDNNCTASSVAIELK